MGQYFIAVNKTKKQYLDTDDMNGGAKFVEIVGSFGIANVLTYLLRQSTGGGGGDIDTIKDMEECIQSAKEDMDKAVRENNKRDYEWWQKYYERFTKQLELAKKQKYAGLWVNDQIALVGDYDISDLYRTARSSFENISSAVIAEIKEQCDIDILEDAKFKQTLRPDIVFTTKGSDE